MLDKAHARLFDAARFFAALSTERRHRVRILAKRLRYALDVMSVALPTEPTEHYLKALADLQDVLGELNDLAVADQHLNRLARSVALRAVAGRWMLERERTLLLDAEDRLALLASLARPWADDLTS